MSFWACALTEQNREKVALRFLTMAGYEVYCPWLGTKRNVVPLFPGYLFVLVADRGWWTARWTIAVRAIVGTHIGELAHVPDCVISDLRSRERNGLIVLPQKPGLQRGDRVRVKYGPMAGHLGLYEGQKGSERVMVLLALLGSVARVEMPKSAIEAAPAGSSAT